MAIRRNLTVDQGSYFSNTITITTSNGAVANLVGYTANAIIKKEYSSLNTAATFTASVNGAYGKITLSLSANQTINVTPGRFVYDVKITDANNVPTRVVEGIVTITPRVT